VKVLSASVAVQLRVALAQRVLLGQGDELDGGIVSEPVL
jgi:hypothetical protein